MVELTQTQLTSLLFAAFVFGALLLLVFIEGGKILRAVRRWRRFYRENHYGRWE